MFQDKSIDPRQCTYRLLATSKLRKQIDRLIYRQKIDFGLIVPKTDPADFYDRINSSTNENQANLINRLNRNRNHQDDDHKDPNIEPNDQDETIEIILGKIERIENILSRVDGEQKQTYQYNDLIELHRLLQHLDRSDRMELAKEYFYEFFEQNFRLMHMPAKRQNASLDERLRKLQAKAASDEYESMVRNVATYVNNRFVGSKISLRQDFRQIRSTIFATINAMMVIGATFFFFYVTINYAWPDYETGKVVLYSFVAAMIVAIAEIYFLLRII